MRRVVTVRAERAYRKPSLSLIERILRGRQTSSVDRSCPVIAFAWLFNNSCNLFTRSYWPLHQTSEPYSATEVTAAMTTLGIRSIDRPPLLLLRLATQ